MVQINTVLVASMVAVPALAAPFRHGGPSHPREENLEARKFKASSALKVAGAAAGAASTGAGLASLIPPKAREFEEELEVRKFKASSALKVAGAAAGAASTGAGLASLIPPKAREFDEELEVREPRKRTNRGGRGGLQSREPFKATARNTGVTSGLQLLVREPRFKVSASTAGHIAAGAGGAAGFAGAVAASRAREYDDELEVRKFKASSAFKVAGAAAGAASTGAGLASLIPPKAREFDEELEVREPIWNNGIVMGAIRAREPKFKVSASTAGHIAAGVGGAAGFAGAVAASRAREYDDELEVRKFKASSAFKVAGAAAGAASTGAGLASLIPPKAREFDELEARRDCHGFGYSVAASSREYDDDMEEFLARDFEEFYDELD